jgi:hypothetical protein
MQQFVDLCMQINFRNCAGQAQRLNPGHTIAIAYTPEFCPDAE